MLRFVAGLTKFRFFEGKHEYCRELFTESEEEEDVLTFSLLYVQCILEAQTPVQHESIFHDKIPSLLRAPPLESPLDAYALGYCISISATRIPWKVYIFGDKAPYLIAGLKSNKCSGGAACIQDLSFVRSSDVHIDEWKFLFVLDALVSLEFNYCHLDNSSLAHLVEHILLLTNLQELSINDDLIEGNSYWMKVLHQLSMINVCNLTFGVFNDGLAPNLYDDYCSALKRLIHPCTGKLKKLDIQTRTCDDKLMRVLSDESSLKSLTLYLDMFPSDSFPNITYFKHNTCLNTLAIHDDDWSASTHISEVIKCNTTLQHLEFGYLKNLDGLELIAQALHGNTTLHEVNIRAVECEDGVYIPRPTFLTDPRVVWKQGL